mmetsp:Transcript_1259/g.1745  ORF Transcript_1259/g.1745 Transcript_1259/m.1745 type:complete len:123 (+) Transcript_1259:76-444(+)
MNNTAQERFNNLKKILDTIPPIALNGLANYKRVNSSVNRSDLSAFAAGDVCFANAISVVMAGYVHIKCKGKVWYKTYAFLGMEDMWYSSNSDLFCACAAYCKERHQTGCFKDKICTHVLTLL